MRPPRSGAGFTLLEVLVALTIVGLAVVSLIELSAQGVRLLRQSSEHQRAVELADRIVRDTEVSEESVDTGEDGLFGWERRVELVPMPEELQPRTIPGAEGAEGPRLFAVTVAVRWGRNQSVEVATLRGPSPVAPGDAAAEPTSPEPATPGGVTPPGAATRPGAAAPPGSPPAAGAPTTPRTPPSTPRPPGRRGAT